MAVLATIEHNFRIYDNAYIRASLNNSDKHLVIIFCEVWESELSRNTYPTPLFIVSYTVNLIDIPCVNPLDYAYKLLEREGILQNAIYNLV